LVDSLDIKEEAVYNRFSVRKSEYTSQRGKNMSKVVGEGVETLSASPFYN